MVISIWTERGDDTDRSVVGGDMTLDFLVYFYIHTESTWIVENDDSMNWLSGMKQPNRKSESRVDTTMKQIELIL
jgi:hypothetical protein